MQHCAEVASVRCKPSTRVEFFAARSNVLCKIAALAGRKNRLRQGMDVAISTTNIYVVHRNKFILTCDVRSIKSFMLHRINYGFALYSHASSD